MVQGGFEIATGRVGYLNPNDPNDAALDFGKAANSMTRITGNEHMTVMYSVDLFWKWKDCQKVQNAPYNSGVCLNGP